MSTFSPDSLNDPQLQAVNQLDGPVLVVAGPGSGKTRVLTHRVAALLERGVAPWQILAVTFTNKAAGEMKERLEGMVGEEASKLWVMTFHALCVRVLRRWGEHIGLARNFTICDSDDAKKIMKKVLEGHGLSSDDAKRYLSAISWSKNNVGTPETIEGDLARLADVFASYQSELERAKLVDFDDLLTLTLRLLRTNDGVRETCQQRFLYVMVDEYQDTNKVQYEIVRILAERHHNICVVGDHDQCLVPSTLISTSAGATAISHVSAGTSVLASRQGGELRSSLVSTAKEGHYEGTVVEVRATGARVVGTPEHFVPARELGLAGYFDVVVLEEADGGFSYTVVESVQSGSGEFGLANEVRTRGAKKGWILARHEDAEAAERDSQWFSELYEVGVPSGGFKNLFGDTLLSRELPHVFGDVEHVVVEMLAEDDCLVHFATKRYDVAGALALCGYEVNEWRGRWALEVHLGSYVEALGVARELSEAFEVDIERRVVIAGLTYRMATLSQLHLGTRVRVANGTHSAEAEIDYVGTSWHSGPVWDLEVAGQHNYVAGGMVVHNSIYSWRGSFSEAVETFTRDFSDASIVTLSQNYRSTKSIVEVSRRLISPNEAIARSDLWTDNDTGEPVVVVGFGDDTEEARWVVHQLRGEKSSVAVIVRTNAQTRPFERALGEARIGYSVVGAQRFYDRAEIRDALAWMRLCLNSSDDSACLRAAKAPKRGLGDKTLDALVSAAAANSMSCVDAMRDSTVLAALSTRARGTCEKFVDDLMLVRSAALSGPRSALEAIYDLGLKEMYALEAERLENLSVLLNDAASHSVVGDQSLDDDTLDGLALTRSFVESVSLSGSSDQGRDGADGELHVALITAHASKGREFDTVFVVGVEDGVYPHRLAGTSKSAVSEERRLLFVAASRARHKLTLTWCARRMVFGSWEDRSPSEFLGPLVGAVKSMDMSERGGSFSVPAALQWSRSAAGRGGESGGLRRATSGGRAPVRGGMARTKPEASLPLTDLTSLLQGTRVRHSVFGEGVILNDATADRVEVRFRDSVKVLSMKFVRLEIL